MKNSSLLARLVPQVLLSMFISFAAVSPSFATGNVVPADLTGNWQMTTVGQTGCGFGTTLYTFTLNSAGLATNVTAISHTGCGDSQSTGNRFQIQSLSANGSGKANLTCGSACGWNLNIQVSPDRSTFNLIDVSPQNPGNFIEGVAVHQ
jgi:hypothetical protein